jgi:hypothetical protein
LPQAQSCNTQVNADKDSHHIVHTAVSQALRVRVGLIA